MAHSIEQKMTVNVAASKVWAVLDDFGSIERFSPTVKHSPVVGAKASGLGAERKCHFEDGTCAVEKIVEYKEGESLRVELTEHPMPFKQFFAVMKVVSVDDKRSEISMAMEFTPKFGPLGWLMANVLLKPMMKKVLKRILKGLAYHAATGLSVGKDLPDENDLKMVLSH